MVSRFTVDGRINDTNLIGLKATMAANSINQSMGWRQSQDIGEEHTMEKYGNLLDQKLEAAKKEMGVNKGIFLSWYNFWTMLILTVFSTSYTVYTAFGLCLWDEIWERIWLPL